MHLKRHGRPDRVGLRPGPNGPTPRAGLSKDMTIVKERKGAGAGKPPRTGGGSAGKTGRRARRSGPKTDELAEWVAKARRMPEVRKGLIERVRAEIEAGTYETPERMKIAIARLLEDLAGQ